MTLHDITPWTKAFYIVDLWNPTTLHLSICQTRQDEDDMNLDTAGPISRVVLSPATPFLLSLASDEVELNFQYDDTVLRLHSINHHDLHEAHHHNFAIIKIGRDVKHPSPERVLIRHIGFSDDGTKFFVCTHDQFAIYDMAEFAPHYPMLNGNNY